MGCLGECWDLGPPPDSILSLPPPPPLPNFLQHPNNDVLQNSTSCSSLQLCESWMPINSRIPENGDYIEMPRKDIESWSVSNIDDTWLLVLVASSIGVLILGALLAMFLLKCREMHMFEGNECTIHTPHHRQIKNLESHECTSVINNGNNKMVHPSETVLYHNGTTIPDNRMVWAALTPHGTQHFISDNYPCNNLVDYHDSDNHYEIVDHLNIHEMSRSSNYPYEKDYDYEDPIPLIESYQLNEMDENQTNYEMVLDNADMRCTTYGYSAASTLRTSPYIQHPRPHVSPPTRIEHPNLPPLNLYPLKNNSLRRNTLNYKNMDAGTLPKYGC